MALTSPEASIATQNQGWVVDREEQHKISLVQAGRDPGGIARVGRAGSGELPEPWVTGPQPLNLYLELLLSAAEGLAALGNHDRVGMIRVQGRREPILGQGHRGLRSAPVVENVTWQAGIGRRQEIHEGT